MDAFQLWCWRRLRVPWTARRSSQSTLKKISPEYSLKGLMLKLKLQYFGHLMQRTDSLEKILMLGKIEGDKRGWDGWMASPTQWTWIWPSSGSRWWTGKPGVLQCVGLPRVRHDWVTELNPVCCILPASVEFRSCFFLRSGAIVELKLSKQEGIWAVTHSLLSFGREWEWGWGSLAHCGGSGGESMSRKLFNFIYA